MLIFRITGQNRGIIAGAFWLFFLQINLRGFRIASEKLFASLAIGGAIRIASHIAMASRDSGPNRWVNNFPEISRGSVNRGFQTVVRDSRGKKEVKLR